MAPKFIATAVFVDFYNRHRTQTFGRRSGRPPSVAGLVTVGKPIGSPGSRVENVAAGAVAHVSVEPRDLFAPAVAARASSVVLAHNHPSGDPEPSAQDVDFTRAMVDAGRILNIDIVDHLIVTPRGYNSFRSSGRLSV